MKTKNSSMLLDTTRKTVNIKQDLAERHLKNGVVEYYIGVKNEKKAIEKALTQFIAPLVQAYSDSMADIMFVCELINVGQKQSQLMHIGILFIGGGGSWEAIPDSLEFRHGSYKLYTVVHYPEVASH